MVSNPSSLGYLRTGLFHVYAPDAREDINKYELKFDVKMKTPYSLFGTMKKIDYIKCDAEGYDAIVLSSMKEMIKKHKPIVQVEVWNKNKFNIYDLFSEIGGYRPVKLQNKQLVEVNENNNIEGIDCLFIHESTRIQK